MFLFELFQNGFIFTFIVAGLASLGHMMCTKKGACQNSVSVSVIIFAGFVHLISCVYILQQSEDSAEMTYKGHSSVECLDYFISAITTNAIFFVVLVYKLIAQNCRTNFKARLFWTTSIGTILLGVYGIFSDLNSNPTSQHQEVFLTVETSDDTQLGVFFSVCKRELTYEKYRLIYEYGLIYLPVSLVVIFAIYESHITERKSEDDPSSWELKIISNQNCTPRVGNNCRCVHLRSAFVSVIVFAAAILLIARPAVIWYAHATSGYFRDVLPSLLQCVLYCVFCIEYILKVLLPSCIKSDNHDCVYISK